MIFIYGILGCFILIVMLFSLMYIIGFVSILILDQRVEFDFIENIDAGIMTILVTMAICGGLIFIYIIGICIQQTIEK